MSVSGRICSSWASATSPITSLIGTMDFLNRPSSHAFLARFWLSTAKASTSARLKPKRVRDQVGADALRREIGGVGDRRIAGPGAAVRAHGHAAHAFDAAGDHHPGLAGHDLGDCHVHGLEPRGAETVDLHARGRLGIAGRQHSEARNVGALFADRRIQPRITSSTLGCVDPVAVADSFQHLRGELDRCDLVKRPVRLAAPARALAQRRR